MYPGWSNSVAGITKNVAERYKREDIRSGRATLATYRSMPIPIIKRDIKVVWVNGVADAYIKVAEKRFKVRLAGGSNYRSQLHGLKTANAVGDSRIWIEKGGKAVIGFACDIPPRVQKDLSGEMMVSSQLDALLVATLPRSKTPFVITGDNIVQEEKVSRVRFQRLRQDRKSGANRREIRQEMSRIAHKNTSRKRTFCHEVSARIVNRAKVKRIKTIILDFTIKSYVKSFPWAMLATMVKYKAEKYGIEVLNKTLTIAEPNVSEPHVYFKYSPATHRIKIGFTNAGKSRHGAETDSAENLVILAIENLPKAKTKQREKHFHAQFNDHRVDLEGRREWFNAEPVLSWLRAVGWLGNAGNLSEIMQVLDVSDDTAGVGHLWAERERVECIMQSGCSQNAESSGDIVGSPATAPAADEMRFSC